MKVLFVGMGSIAQKHLLVLQELLPETEIFALRSSSSSKEIENVTSVYKIEDVPTKLDFAIISNPTYLHLKTLLQLLPKNTPLLIEKPIVHSVKAANILLKNFDTKDLVSLISCNLRFHPCIIFLKEHLTQLHWIEINAYCGSYLPDWRPDTNYLDSYSSDRTSGGGVDLDLIHELDYIYYLIGKPKRVHSNKGNISSLGINAPDYAKYLLEFDKGIVNVSLNYYRRKPRRTIEIITKDDVLIVDLLKYTIFSEVENKIIFTEKIERLDLLKRQMSYFLNCVSKNQPTMNPINDSIEVLKICLNDEKE